ncbi:hypothetical protein Pyn_20028 [Prunus yedoensis var. nudiflora]|uniref:Uncharacterized protein n=1 Tax=Prunus yedoensis var. nudiflora TaxID=2094558 RepID=A0A314ZYZ7_PRUYE|nr:hypothetical protein Pyn_20028 [Prunus yedoensis var. nudiflora]
MNPRSLSRQAQLGPAIARYNTAEPEHKHATRHATLNEENLYFSTEPRYKLKWAYAKKMPGLVEQVVAWMVLGCLGAPKSGPFLEPKYMGKHKREKTA